MEFSGNSKRDYVLAALGAHERHLTRYAVRMLNGNTDLAADAVQYSFLKLCEQTSRQPEPQLKAWLFTVCRNRIIDDLRKNQRMKTLKPDYIDQTCEGDSPVGQWLDDQESLLRIRDQIQRMPKQDREIIELWSHGFAHQEIAEITSQERGTVRVQLHRAIKSLKEKMAYSEGV